MAEPKPNPQEVMNELQGMLNAHIKLAFEQYKELKETYWHSERNIEFLKSVTPKSFHENLENTKKWMDQQLSMWEDNLDKIISETRTWKSEGGVPAPALKEIQAMVNTHMRLAFKEYRVLKDRYSTPSKATIVYLKTVAPATTHEALDRLDAWLDEQTSNAESYMVNAMGDESPSAEPKKKRK